MAKREIRPDEYRPPKPPLVPFVKGVSPSEATKKKQLTTRKKNELAVKAAHKQGYDEALEKFTPGVVRRLEKQGKLLEVFLDQMAVAAKAGDMELVRSLMPMVSEFNKKDKESMDRAHGTPVARQKIESTNTNVNVEIHLNEVFSKFPIEYAQDHEMIDVEVVD